MDLPVLFRRPENQNKVVLEEWQFRACDENGCAAILLSYFEFWHRLRLVSVADAEELNRKAIQAGKEPTQDTGLHQWHTAKRIEKRIFLFKEDTIRKGIELLVKKGFISVIKNPNPSFYWDQTRYFMFNVETVKKYLYYEYGIDPSENSGMQTPIVGPTPPKSPISLSSTLSSTPQVVEEKKEEKTVATQPALLTQCSSPRGLLEAAQGTLLPEAPTPPKKQKKEQQPIPLPDMLRTPETQAAWDLWLQHRKEKRAAVTPSSAKMNFKLLEEIGSSRWISAIEYSIRNGYQGLFEPKESPRTGGAPPYVKPKVTAMDREKAMGHFEEHVKLNLPDNAVLAERQRKKEAARAARLAAMQTQQQNNEQDQKPNETNNQ